MRKLFLLLLSSTFFVGCSDQVMTELDAVAVAPAANVMQSKNARQSNDEMESKPLNLSFTKSLTDPAGIWQGTISGDMNGQLTTKLLALTESGPIWHVTFDWIIVADDPEKSFTARLKGILNTKTGMVIMNGEVIEGWLLGAQVHEEGQMMDAETSTFEGTIKVLHRSGTRSLGE